MNRLYYVAPKESREFILKNGILTPIEVRELIKKGELPKEVLGISFGGYDNSNFLEYVSLVRDFKSAIKVAQAISFSRTQIYENPDFMAIGYSINTEIEKDFRFVDEKRTREMNSDCYPCEVLFKGKIGIELINEHNFAVRPYFR